MEKTQSSGGGYLIRAATAADLPGVAELFNRYLGTGSMALTPLSAADFAFLLEETDRSLLLVACIASPQSGPVGYASVKPWSPRGGYKIAGEVSIFLHPLYTGSGIGGDLYRELLPASERMGYRYLAARIRSVNVGSIRFHERHGFSLVGVQRGIGLINGERQDNTLMERVLP